MERQPSPPPESPRYFTLEEAHRVLPRVREVIDRLRALSKDIEGTQQAVRDTGHGPPAARAERGHGTERGANGTGHNGAGRRLFGALTRLNGLVDEMRRLVAELETIGCEVKDVQTGLVDFRAMRDGRAVYLCWRAGEDRIRYWHELDVGFAGRQPL